MIPTGREQLWLRRPELVVRPHGDNGQFVVKDPRSGSFYFLGVQEHFLLMQLDGRTPPGAICASFVERFGEPLTPDDLEAFIELAHERSLLQAAPSRGDDRVAPATIESPRWSSTAATNPSPMAVRRKKQSLLYWRKAIFDPNRLFEWLEPRVRLFWTPAFVILSAASILLAAWLSWTNATDMAQSFQAALRWETAILACLVLFIVIMLHEFAHGLTCKHYGGEVREIGFLLMFFMPCLYCNVSDAWLFREKSKRLWVTLAGGYFELFLWSLAVFVWRLTMEDTLVNYLAFVVLSVCGVQSLFNFNPLIRLDGYYLLSDWAEVPNLRQEASGYVKAHLRRLLWGAERPTRQPHGRLLLAYGTASLLFSLVFLGFMLVGVFHFAGAKWGWLGVCLVMLLGMISTRGLLRGLSAGEVRMMIATRRKRATFWLLAVAGLAAVLCLMEVDDRVGGTVYLRPTVRAEVRSPVAAFLKEIYFDEGSRVSAGMPMARLDIPDLASRIAEKDAEAREAQARLKMLEEGTRPEELAEQRQRVARARSWRDLAEKDLAHARLALSEELARLDQQVAQYRFECDAAQDAYQRAETLRGQSVVTEEQYREAKRRVQVSQSQFEQAEFQKRHRQALGTREAIAGLDAEAELARREKDLADTLGTLALMEAGTRPEEIEAARAHLAMLREEAHYLHQLDTMLLVRCPTSGLVTTARLKEKISEYFREGDLICLIEEPASLEAEIALAEQDIARVKTGLKVEFKARAMPFETFRATVERISPSATHGDLQGTITVYCRLENADVELRPEMSGYARISIGRRPISIILIDRVLRFLRTEFWW